jgi:hypothetical protein
MAGERSEVVRRAVLALMDEALPDDFVELRWFSERLSAGIPLVRPQDSRRPADRDEARRRAVDQVFAAEVGGGPTALLAALRELAVEREKLDREAWSSS